jgi:hypothetical protein
MGDAITQRLAITITVATTTVSRFAVFRGRCR